MHRSGILFVGLLMFAGLAMAADETKQTPRFELKDGDRVVLLGGTLIEREQKYGHWEAMLTARYPDRNITFRNLGWDGDTVWAESRGIFDTPEVGYARMIEQVKGLKPTVIFLGYGNNEAFAGKEGLEPFVKQYEKLIDDLTAVSADGVRFFFILPMVYDTATSPIPDLTDLKDRVLTYAKAIREVAVRRNMPAFVQDLYPGEVDRKKFPISPDGLHLNEPGYRNTAFWISSQYSRLTGTEYLSSHILVKVDRTLNQSTYKPFEVTFKDGGVVFEATREYLNADSFLLLLEGLTDDRHTLFVDSRPLRTATGKQWREEVGNMTNHPDRDQYEALREAIIAKNELYFHSWRPQNVTYLFGFRKHEQGQNAKETAEFAKLVAEKEAEIARLKKPVPHKYELTRAKVAK